MIPEYVSTKGIPIHAMINMMVNVLGLDAALKMVTLFAASLDAVTRFGNRAQPNRATRHKITTELETKACPGRFP
jgi:hypothetical protein